MSKKMKKRLWAIVLSCILLVTLFAGCSGKEEPKATDATTAPAATDATTEDEGFDLSKTDSWSDDKWLAYEKSLDFGGKTFKLMSGQPDRRGPTESGETELDKKFRDLFAELNADLNIDIQVVPEEGDFSAMLMAGDNYADIYDKRPANWLAYAAQGLVFDWSSDEALSYGVNVNNPKLFWQPWTHAMDELGGTYGVRFASEYYPADAGWLVVCNNEILDTAGYKDVEQMVFDGTWDWDKYLEIAKKCTVDKDMDGTPDTWGVGTGYAAYGEEVLTGNGKVVSFDKTTGKFTASLTDADTLEGLGFISKIAKSGTIMPGADGDANIGYSEGHAAFIQGKIALLSTELRLFAKNAYSKEFQLGNAAFTFTILPMPKKPGTSTYYNIIGNHDYDMMLNSHKDKEFAVKVYAAFARRQNDEDWTASLADSYLQDPDDKDALKVLSDYVIPNIKFNYQWLTNEINELYRKEIVYKTYDIDQNPATLAESINPQLQALLDKVQFNVK